MRRSRGLALALALLGVAALAVAAAEGELQVGLVLVVPVVLGTGPWSLAGVLLLAGAALAWFAHVARRAPAGPRAPEHGPRSPGDAPGVGTGPRPGEDPAEPVRREGADGDEGGGSWNVGGGGVLLLGPLPVVVGSDARWTVLLVLLAILLVGVLWATGFAGV